MITHENGQQSAVSCCDHGNSDRKRQSVERGAQCGEISVESRGEKKGKHSVSMTKKLDHLKLH